MQTRDNNTIQKNFWAFTENKSLGFNNNAFGPLFQAACSNYLFFRPSVYNRSIKQFILQAGFSCETPLDYFSMVWTSSVDASTNFFIQRFAYSLQHNFVGQQQVNSLYWLPGTVSNLHKIRAIALQNRADFRLLTNLRHLESARLGSGSFFPVVFHDLNVLSSPTYLFSLASRATFNEVKNLRVPLASLQNVLAGLDPQVFGRIRPVLQLPFSSNHNKTLRHTHFSLFRQISLRSWKRAWREPKLSANFLSFKQNSSYARRYVLTARTRPVFSSIFRGLPRSFFNSRWLGPVSQKAKRLRHYRFSKTGVGFAQNTLAANKGLYAPKSLGYGCGIFSRSRRRNTFVGTQASSNIADVFLKPFFFFAWRWSFGKYGKYYLKRPNRHLASIRPRFFAPAKGGRLVETNTGSLNVNFFRFSSRSGWGGGSTVFSEKKKMDRFAKRGGLSFFRGFKSNYSRHKRRFSPALRVKHDFTLRGSNKKNFLTVLDSRLFFSRPPTAHCSNVFFRLSTLHPFCFSRLRKFRRFYRKRLSLFSRANFTSKFSGNVSANGSINAYRFSSYPLRFFFSRSRFVSTQFLRIRWCQKRRLLNLFRSFSAVREHPILRLGSRRRFYRFLLGTNFTSGSSRRPLSPDGWCRSLRSFFGGSQSLLLEPMYLSHQRSLLYERFLFLGAVVPSFYYADHSPWLLPGSGVSSWNQYWPWFFSSSPNVPFSVIPAFPPLSAQVTARPRFSLPLHSRFTMHRLRRARIAYYAYFRMADNMRRIRNPGVSLYQLHRFSRSFVARRFITSLDRSICNRVNFITWSDFFFPSFFRPLLRSRQRRRIYLFKQLPFSRRRSLVRRWCRYRFLLRRRKWEKKKKYSSKISFLSFYRSFFKVVSSPTTDVTRGYLRRHVTRKYRCARIATFSRSARLKIFSKYLAYSYFLRSASVFSRKKRFRLRFGSRYFFQHPLNLSFFSESDFSRRWWLVKVRFFRFSQKTRFIADNKFCFARRGRLVRGRNRFLRRYFLLRYGFLVSRSSQQLTFGKFIGRNNQNHVFFTNLNFYRALFYRGRRYPASNSFSLRQHLRFLRCRAWINFRFFLLRRHRRFIQRCLLGRRPRFFSRREVGIRQRCRFRRRSRFFHLHVLLTKMLLPSSSKFLAVSSARVLSNKLLLFPPAVSIRSFFTFAASFASIFNKYLPGPRKVTENHKKLLFVPRKNRFNLFSLPDVKKKKPLSFLIAVKKNSSTAIIPRSIYGKNLSVKLPFVNNCFVFSPFFTSFPFSGFCLFSRLRYFYCVKRYSQHRGFRFFPRNYHLISRYGVSLCRFRSSTSVLLASRGLKHRNRWFFRFRLLKSGVTFKYWKRCLSYSYRRFQPVT